MIRSIVIDDDKETVHLFTELLKSNGIDVVGKGYNGQDAIFLFQKLKPDIIYLDDVMPVYDGIYALQKIRAIDPQAIIIMIVGRTSIDNEVKMQRFNPSAVIVEPIDVNEIIKKTHQLCDPTLDSIKQMNKTMINLILKNTLLELGTGEYDKVVTLLQKDFDCNLEDCFEHPEYLNQVLHDLFGKSYQNIISSIKENLKNNLTIDDIDDFVQNLTLNLIPDKRMVQKD